MTADIDAAADAIRRGDLVVYPTETVYGLGADALDADAVERVYAAKRRPRGDPVSVAFPSADAAFAHTAPSDAARDFMDAVLPGPVTPLVPRRETIPDAVTAGGALVGVRVSSHDVPRRLTERAGPITSTSANRSGEPSATSADAVDAAIRDAAAVVLDAPCCEEGEGSTVVDTEDWRIVRRGARVDAVEHWIEAHVDG